MFELSFTSVWHSMISSLILKHVFSLAADAIVLIRRCSFDAIVLIL